MDFSGSSGSQHLYPEKKFPSPLNETDLSLRKNLKFLGKDIDKHWENNLTWLSRSGSVVASAMMLVIRCVTLSGLRSISCVSLKTGSSTGVSARGQGCGCSDAHWEGRELRSPAPTPTRKLYRPLRLYYILLKFTKRKSLKRFTVVAFNTQSIIFVFLWESVI